MSDKRTLLCTALLAAGLAPAAGCVTEQKKSLTVVGSSNHEPYPAKPEYLGTRALPDPSTLQRGPVAARIHVSAPVVDNSGDDSDPGVAESATTPAPEPAEPAPQQVGGSFTVAPSDPAPQPNREPDVQQTWQPTIQAGNPPQDHP